MARIDADSTRLKGELVKQLAQVHDGEVDVLVGTQMVAKGHDFRRVSLVVALNTDASVRRLGKGTDRPINPLADRLAVMAALGSVDLVTWFDEDNPQALIAEIRPDILVKGGDYHMDVLPETALMHTWGGKALALPFVSGYSTTALVKRIRAQSS